MKKLLVFLLSLFFLISPSVFADDISDFQIEGISIGDSLLDYMTEDEILEEIELNKDMYSFIKEPNKYAEIYTDKNLQTYDYIAVFIKNNSIQNYVTNKNEEYTILSIRGVIHYQDNFESCIPKRDGINKDLSRVFPDLQKEESVFEHTSYPGSNIDQVEFIFDSGARFVTSCRDFLNRSNELNFVIRSNEIQEWLSDHK